MLGRKRLRPKGSFPGICYSLLIHRETLAGDGCLIDAAGAEDDTAGRWKAGVRRDDARSA